MYRLLLRVKKKKRLAFFKLQLGFTIALVVVISLAAMVKSLFVPSLNPPLEEVEIVPHPAGAIELNRCSCTWDSMKLKRDDYAAKHRPAAQKLASGKFVSDEAVMSQLLSKGKLVPYNNRQGVRIRKLTHSEPYLHPRAADTFDDLAERFNKRLVSGTESDANIVISSVTRTANQQKEILKRYPYGATPGESTHSYGASIDILFVETAGNCYNARKALELTLRELQKENKIYICPESKCIHLTATN